mmetsp:Transcript_22282/g.50971  ORF Transcript_22282/g.50971 Transcript_22282/m.50971 type:complete len:329 (+) Transcript_22282:109-1095(+)
MNTTEVLAWMREGLALSEDAASKASDLFKAHSVNGSLLDFFISYDGARLLNKYQRHFAVKHTEETSATRKASHRGGESGQEEENSLPCARHEAQEATVATPEAAPKHKPHLLGRQKLSSEMRRNEGPYFKQQRPPPRAELQSQQQKGKTKVQGDAIESSADTETTGTLRKASATEETTACNCAASRCKGVLKSFHTEKGWGFIKCQEIPQDVFIVKAELPKQVSIEVGRMLEFDLVIAGEKPQAKSAVWVSSDDSQQRYVGTLKSLGDDYGFIDCPETQNEYGRDVYISRGLVPESSKVGDAMAFAVVVNAKGQPQARQVARPDGQRW